MPSVDVIVPHFGEHWMWRVEAIGSIREEPVHIITSDIIVRDGVSKIKVCRNFDSSLVTEVPCEYPLPSYAALYSQINAGLDSSGDYVLVFGSDDIMYHGMIANMIAVAEEKNARVVYCNYELMNSTGKHIDYVRINPRYDFGLNCRSSHYPDVSLFRRDTIEEFGGWDVSKGRYAMWWLWLQIGRKYPSDIHHCDYYGFRYRQHDGGMSKREIPADREAFMQSVREWLGHAKSNH